MDPKPIIGIPNLDANLGDEVRVPIKRNPVFELPSDPSKPSVLEVAPHRRALRPRFPQLNWLRLDKYRLTDLVCGMHTFNTTAISPSGGVCALVGTRNYAVFRCDGTTAPNLITSRFYCTTHEDGTSKPLILNTNDCAALSDQFLVVGNKGRLMATSVTEIDSKSPFLIWYSLQNAEINRIVFSNDSKRLLVLMRINGKEQSYQEALVFLIDTDSSGNQKPSQCSIIKWRPSTCCNTVASFSQNGQRIAICTSVSGRNEDAEIRLLRQKGNKWGREGSFRVKVRSGHPDTTEIEKGFSGIALYAPSQSIE